MLKIWDVSTRLYHWLQAFLFFALVISAYGGLGKDVHQSLGLCLIVLLVWRIGWGLFGSETSRFSQFVRSPREVLRYLRGHNSAGHNSAGHNSAGHNPLGALMVIALVSSLFLQGSIGLMMSDWVEGKALLGRSVIRTLGDIHELNALLLLTLSAIHIITVLMYTVKGRNLVGPMVTGLTKMPEQVSEKVQQPKMASNSKAIVWLICSAMGIAGIIKLLS
jgi:cytochrome b